MMNVLIDILSAALEMTMQKNAIKYSLTSLLFDIEELCIDTRYEIDATSYFVCKNI